jgi:hypothetical protein
MKKQRHLRVRRAGIGKVVIHKSAFASWLDEAPRAELTFAKLLPKVSQPPRMGPGEKGWTCEEFTLEALARGVKSSYQTTCKRRAGVIPRPESRGNIEKAFPGIAF